MSIEPTCDYCGYSDKLRCKSTAESMLCPQYKEKQALSAIHIKVPDSIKEAKYPVTIGKIGLPGESGSDGSSGTRDHIGKQYSRLVPLEAIAAGAASLEYGAHKYASRNWEKGLPWQVMIDSLKRHIEDFERGSDYDDGEDGSNLPQVCMIMASAMMLSASYMRNIGKDDRVKDLPKEAMSAKECTIWIDNMLKKTSVDKFTKESK